MKMTFLIGIMFAGSIINGLSQTVSASYKLDHDNESLGVSHWVVTLTNKSKSEVKVDVTCENDYDYLRKKTVGPDTVGRLIEAGETTTITTFATRLGVKPILTNSPPKYTNQTSEPKQNPERPGAKGGAITPITPPRSGGRGEKTPEQLKWEKERITGEQVQAACLDFYHKQGEWAGEFRITGVTWMRTVRKSDGSYTTHVGYNYIGISGPRKRRSRRGPANI